ncbi:MAG TPA: efflux RND transporter periplasmic adaptor subunit [Candidatus Paceibacterota bacterium]|nr:efflux RND transporter periplasmic adaptor subunit [Candidatus Paceibacterota bacterium]
MKAFFKRKLTWIIIAAVVVIGIIYFSVKNKGSGYQFITVTQGTISQTVSVTGNSTPAQSLDLAFENGGTIATVNKNAGDTVAVGDVLVTLDTSDLQAQLAQAQASVDAAQAQLASLEAGAQPANIAQSQAAVTAAEQTLTNTYGNVPSTLQGAYAQAYDAVRNQIAPFFSGAESVNPQLTFSLNNSQTLNNIISERVQASTELNDWQNELNALGPGVTTSTLETALTEGQSHLTAIQNLLQTAAQALIEETSLSPTTLASYKTALATAVNETTQAENQVSTSAQSIASEKIAITQAQAALNVTLAGSTTQQIQAQQAQVEEAQANAQSVQVKINEATLTSPIDGVVTVQNANVGEIAQPGQTIVSVISTGNLEVDAYVPETDIGKVNLADPVTMTFNAFQGQTFTGKVFYIDPAQTILQGVVDYKVKVSIDNPGSDMKSGLTANLDIETETHNNALILPQYAVLQTDQGSFVEILQSGKETQVPVTTGIQDENGNVEILTGVTAGEQVLNIGLKSS